MHFIITTKIPWDLDNAPFIFFHETDCDTPDMLLLARPHCCLYSYKGFNIIFFQGQTIKSKLLTAVTFNRFCLSWPQDVIPKLQGEKENALNPEWVIYVIWISGCNTYPKLLCFCIGIFDDMGNSWHLNFKYFWHTGCCFVKCCLLVK